MTTTKDNKKKCEECGTSLNNPVHICIQKPSFTVGDVGWATKFDDAFQYLKLKPLDSNSVKIFIKLLLLEEKALSHQAGVEKAMEVVKSLGDVPCVDIVEALQKLKK